MANNPQHRLSDPFQVSSKDKSTPHHVYNPWAADPVQADVDASFYKATIQRSAHKCGKTPNATGGAGPCAARKLG